MTDLTGKFAAFETQSETNHTELMAALDSIAYALGAPPSTPTVTIADVNTTLGLINTNIALQLSRDATYHASMLSVLGQINTNTDTLINNSSLNAQRLLTAILTTACACPSDAPFLQPIIDVTPTDLVGEAKCRRIQFYLSVFGAAVDGIANYGGTGAMVTSAVITEIMYAAAVGGALVGGEVGAVAGPPGIVVGAIVGIIGALIGALGSSYIFQMSAQWHQSPLPEQLLAALYAADNAESGLQAFYDTINASDVLNLPYKPLLNALFWNSWANEIYGATPVVDDSAFDGMACAPPPEVFPPVTDCITLNSVSGITRSDSVSAQFIVWPTGGSNTLPSSVRPGGFDTITASDSIWYIGSLEGYYLKSSVSTRIYVNPNGANRTMDLIAGEYQLVPFSTAYVEAGAGTAFTLEVCKSV